MRCRETYVLWLFAALVRWLDQFPVHRKPVQPWDHLYGTPDYPFWEQLDTAAHVVKIAFMSSISTALNSQVTAVTWFSSRIADATPEITELTCSAPTTRRLLSQTWCGRITQ